MRLRTIIILILALIWAAISWRWYTCGVRGFCGNAAETVQVAEPTTDPAALDSDGDGVSDMRENLFGTDVTNVDSDGDGVHDLYELGLDDTAIDTDGDNAINALDPDDDNDGTNTADESPDNNGDGNPADALDSDGDGVANFLDLGDQDGPDGDLDGDNLSNSDEAKIGSNINDADTDGDGINDFDEAANFSLPDSDSDGLIDVLDATTDGPETDSDGDGLNNGDEKRIGSDPFNIDTDGDGLDDAVEVGNDLQNPMDSDDNGTIDVLQGYVVPVSIAPTSEPIVVELTPEPVALVVADSDLKVIVAPGSLDARIHFPYNNASNPSLTANSETYFEQVAEQSQAGQTVILIGHTDNIGGAAFNKALGAKRAETIKQMLVVRGADKSLIHASSQGESQPVESNDTLTGRDTNRRVELTVTTSN